MKALLEVVKLRLSDSLITTSDPNKLPEDPCPPDF